MKPRKIYEKIQYRVSSRLFLFAWIKILPLWKKNYSKLFGESLFKTIKNYSHYASKLNWRTIGGTIEVNRQKLLLISIKIYKKKFVDCGIYSWHIHILSLDVIRKWISSNKFFYLYRGSNLCPTYISLYLQATTLPTGPTITW